MLTVSVCAGSHCVRVCVCVLAVTLCVFVSIGLTEHTDRGAPVSGSQIRSDVCVCVYTDMGMCVWVDVWVCV